MSSIWHDECLRVEFRKHLHLHQHRSTGLYACHQDIADCKKERCVAQTVICLNFNRLRSPWKATWPLKASHMMMPKAYTSPAAQQQSTADDSSSE